VTELDMGSSESLSQKKPCS